MSTYMNDAVNVSVPTEGDCVQLATSGTSFNYNIPAKWRGRWVTITAVTSALELLCGDDSVDVVYGDTNSVSGEDITAKDTVGGHFPAGVPLDFRFPDPEAQYTNAAGTKAKFTKFAVEAAGAGFINMRLSNRRF